MSNAWDRLSSEQKFNTLFSHVEWVVFQAQLLGIDIDQRLSNAVAKAKNALAFDGGDWEQLSDLVNIAWLVFKEAGGEEMLGKDKVIGKNKMEMLNMEQAVAYMCYCITHDVWLRQDVLHRYRKNKEMPDSDPDLRAISHSYLLPLTSVKQQLTQQSPLDKWMTENDIEPQ